MGCECIPGHPRLSADGPVWRTSMPKPPAGPGRRLGLCAFTLCTCTEAISIHLYYNTERPECKSRNYPRYWSLVIGHWSFQQAKWRGGTGSNGAPVWALCVVDWGDSWENEKRRWSDDWKKNVVTDSGSRCVGAAPGGLCPDLGCDTVDGAGLALEKRRWTSCRPRTHPLSCTAAVAP